MEVTRDEQSSHGRWGGGTFNVFHIIIDGDDNFEEEKTDSPTIDVLINEIDRDNFWDVVDWLRFVIDN